MRLLEMWEMKWMSMAVLLTMPMTNPRTGVKQARGGRCLDLGKLNLRVIQRCLLFELTTTRNKMDLKIKSIWAPRLKIPKDGSIGVAVRT